jgi:hypothetical protein
VPKTRKVAKEMDSSIACHKFTCSVSFDKKCFSRCHSYALIMPLDTEMRGRMPQYQIEKPFDRHKWLKDLVVGGASVVLELYSNLCSGNTRHLCICISKVQKLGQAAERHQSRQMCPSNLWPLLCSNSRNWRAGSLLACPQYPLTRLPESCNTKTNASLVDRCSWNAETGCLRMISHVLLRSYVQVVAYMYAQFLWLHLLLRPLGSSLERLRP